MVLCITDSSSVINISYNSSLGVTLKILVSFYYLYNSSNDSELHSCFLQPLLSSLIFIELPQVWVSFYPMLSINKIMVYPSFCVVLRMVPSLYGVEKYFYMKILSVANVKFNYLHVLRYKSKSCVLVYKFFFLEDHLSNGILLC